MDEDEGPAHGGERGSALGGGVRLKVGGNRRWHALGAAGRGGGVTGCSAAVESMRCCCLNVEHQNKVVLQLHVLFYITASRGSNAFNIFDANVFI